MTDAPTIAPEFTDTAGAASLTSIPAETLRALRRTDNGPPFLRIGRTVRYSLADLRAWMAAQSTSPNP